MGILIEAPLVPVDIIVDSREASKNQDIIEGLRKAKTKVAVSALSVGDYFLPASEDKKPILVERKTVTDFLNSIRDNRIWEQLKIIKKAEEEEDIVPVILLEGYLGIVEKYTKWKLTSILRIIDEIVIDWNVRIIPSPNKKATISWLIAKAKSLGSAERKKPPRLRVEKKPMDINTRILYVAEGIVGPTLARRLLKKFKTIRNIANANITELMSIEGIGEKRAKEIYAIFNTPWKP